MLLSKKYIFKNDKVNMTILQHMGYSAYKLWNVGNYEKRNYEKLGMKKFPVYILKIIFESRDKMSEKSNNQDNKTTRSDETEKRGLVY